LEGMREKRLRDGRRRNEEEKEKSTVGKTRE
jgi:hypothetical protein